MSCASCGISVVAKRAMCGYMAEKAGLVSDMLFCIVVLYLVNSFVH